MPWDLLIRPKRAYLALRNAAVLYAVLAPRHDVWRASFAAGAAMPGAQPRGGQLKANNAFGGIASTRSCSADTIRPSLSSGERSRQRTSGTAGKSRATEEVS